VPDTTSDLSRPPQWPTPEQAARSRLFSSLPLSPSCTLEKRTWVPAMVPWRATETGEATGALLDWYGRFARGCPGALVVEATGVRDIPSGPLLRIHSDRFISGLGDIARTIERNSSGHTRAFIQLIDFLRIRRRTDWRKYIQRYLPVNAALVSRLEAATSRPLPGKSTPGFDEAIRSQLLQLDQTTLAQVLGPRSTFEMNFGARQRVTDLAVPEVAALPQTLPGAFARAAQRAEQAGFAGVEIHAAHAYTLASFLSALNTRDDGYGGSLSGRLRLPLAIYDAVRSAVSTQTVVGIRMNLSEDIDGGYGCQEAASIAKAFADRGVDYISLSRGGKFEDARQPVVGRAAYPYTGMSGLACMPTKRAFGANARRFSVNESRAIKQSLLDAGHRTPLVLAGGLHTFADAESALQTGACDVVAAARQSLADPDWWLKMEAGRGESVVRCTLTNYCEGLDQKHKAVTCRLWDRVPLEPDELHALNGPAQQGSRRLIAPRGTD